MKKEIIIFIVCVIISCETKPQSEKIAIKGNWYTYDSITKDISGKNFINYTEYYFDENKMYIYNELTGMGSPKNYYFKKDSLFIGFNEKKTYVGVIDTIMIDKFLLKNNNLVKKYYLLNSEAIVLEKIINKKNKENNFSEFFFDRLNNLIIELEK